jgi:hypothetical protein
LKSKAKVDGGSKTKKKNRSKKKADIKAADVIMAD